MAHNHNRRRMAELERENAALQTLTSHLRQFRKLQEECATSNPLATTDHFLCFYKNYVAECARLQYPWAVLRMQNRAVSPSPIMRAHHPASGPTHHTPTHTAAAHPPALLWLICFFHP